jgi:carbon-monoxide dehydrogenase large subunit
MIGTSIPARDTRRYVTGSGAYVEDTHRPEMLHLAVVRSPWAHAAITAIDTSQAQAMPGVVAVVTAADLPERAAMLPASPRLPGLDDVAHPTLARDVVRYVGEPVAVVAAESRAAAWDAAQAVAVTYEPRPTVSGLDAALATGAAPIHAHRDSNVLFTFDLNVGPDDEPPGVHIIEIEMTLPRVAAVPLEGRAVLSEVGPDGRLEVWISTQSPHRARDRFAQMLGLDRSMVRVRTPDVGGAFGAKGGNPWSEDVVAAWLALRLRRPVRWVETRREGLLAMPHGRGQRARLRAAVDAEGRLLSVEIDVDLDVGAYCLAPTPGPVLRTANVITGPYRISRLRLRARGVATHRVPTGPYRGAGRPEATYYLERLMDLIAADMGLDPVEVRRRNFVRPDEMPYDTGTDLALDSGDYAALMDRALAEAGLAPPGGSDSDDATLNPRGREGSGEADVLRGIGFATFAEVTGGSFPEYGRVEVHGDGRVVVACGISPHGQGTETALAQVAADRLGVPIERITVVTGDTDFVPEGIGTFGSRSLTLGGTAVDQAARAVRDRLAREAARRLEAAPGEIAFDDGRASVAGSPEQGIPIEVLVGVEPVIEEARFNPPGAAVSFGAHVAAVEISRETGEVRVTHYTALDDPGVIVNPALLEGQLYGGIMQGIGTALIEEVAYDGDGQMLTASLLDYGIPRVRHLPEIRLSTQETPSPTTPLRAKGAGEAGTIGALAAIANAVVRALAPLGVRHLDPPYTPQRMLRILHSREHRPS